MYLYFENETFFVKKKFRFTLFLKGIETQLNEKRISILLFFIKMFYKDETDDCHLKIIHFLKIKRYNYFLKINMSMIFKAHARIAKGFY